MNIHIKDKVLFDDLLDSTFFNIKMGSDLYGLRDENSDTDFLCIYAPSLNQMSSFNKSIHQIQYKDIEHEVDYVFTDMYTFFWNLLNGDSTINFEIIHTSDYKNSEFGEYFDFLTPKLRSYSTIVSYLGFANRDIKHFWKEKTDRDKVKKLLHIERSFNFAKQIFNDYENFSLIDNSLLEKRKLYQLLSGQGLNEFCKGYIESISEDIKKFRQEILNVALEKKEINRFLSFDDQEELDDKLFHFSQKPIFLNKQQKFLSLEPYYLVNENELKY